MCFSDEECEWRAMVLTWLFVVLLTVAAFCRCFPSRMGCNSMKRVVMGDMYRYRNDTSMLIEGFFSCVCVFVRV